MKNITVFASGRGSNFRKICEQVRSGYIPGKVNLLVYDAVNCYGGARPGGRGKGAVKTEVRPRELPLLQPQRFLIPHFIGKGSIVYVYGVGIERQGELAAHV